MNEELKTIINHLTNRNIMKIIKLMALVAIFMPLLFSCSGGSSSSGMFGLLPDKYGKFVEEKAKIEKEAENIKSEAEKKELIEKSEKLNKEWKAYEVYKGMVEKGIAREIARINLPLALYTEFYWQMDLHNLFHFLKLRLDSHAQYEIRLYAEKILEIIKTVCPMAVSSFENTMEKAVSFNGEEMEALRKVLNGEENPIQDEKKLKRFNEKIKTGVQL